MTILQKGFLAANIMIGALALGSMPAFSQMSLSIEIAPPPLQVEVQPACPDDDYLWTPGYWAYDNNAYYWVPGAWVQPPQIDVLWTPPYWGSDGSNFVFYPGYWGPNVGYYGGINYGYGYGGNGYGGGRWQGGHFAYNSAVNNVNSPNIHNRYVDRSVVNNNASKVSYNGGKGGTQVQPTAQERQYASERHVQQPLVKQPDAIVHSQAPPEQKAVPQQEPAQMQQPEHQQPMSPPQQQTPSTQQQEIQPKPDTHLQPQGQAQPKQESHTQQQSQQPGADKKAAAQPDKKSDKDPNGPPPNH